MLYCDYYHYFANIHSIWRWLQWSIEKKTRITALPFVLYANQIQHFWNMNVSVRTKTVTGTVMIARRNSVMWHRA